MPTTGKESLTSPSPADEFELGSQASQRHVTFADICAVIKGRQRLLAQHSFLRALEADATWAYAERVIPRLAFFVMGFQDILRLIHSETTDPELREFAANHAVEDQGHDLWYLHDIEHLGITCNLALVFAKDDERVRDLTYSLVADVLKAANDSARLSIALSLEAIGAEFFGRMIGCLERVGRADGLRYFARRHQVVEQNHEILNEGAIRLEAMRLTPNAVPEVLEVVDRTFSTMARLADYLVASAAPCESEV